MPEEKLQVRYIAKEVGADKYRIWDTVDRIFTESVSRTKKQSQSTANALNKISKKPYKSSHWDEPNVIAHIRGDVRIGPDGKRRFHIAEFQSDIYSRIVELEALEPIGELKGEVAKELANLKGLFPWGENWHELVAKKALEYAVKNDLDGISWDTAKTQVDRWESALRKNIDKIDWSKGYSGPKQFSSQFDQFHHFS